MSTKLNEVLPRESGTFGVWLQDTSVSDVHVYLSNGGDTDGGGVIIGQNKNYPTLKFTDIAINMKKDGKVILQYDDNGSAKSVEVDPEIVRLALFNFLHDVKGQVV